MAKVTPYEEVLVESYIPEKSAGKHGKVHIRPVAGYKYSPNLHVECSKKLSENYPVGTRFKLQAKLTDRASGGEYLYSSYRWAYQVVSE